MAKLNAPLFSFKASGAIAKALVYFGWKGLNVVRSYVVPANPRTSAQTTHRAYLTAAVAAIHAAQAFAANPLDEEDLIAYAALASTRSTPRTWFNEIVKLWIDAEVLSDIPVIYTDGNNSDPDRASLNMSAKIREETASELAAGKFYMGKSKTSLIHTAVATVNDSVSVVLTDSDQSAWIAVGDKIYWQFRPDTGDPCEGADSGIYYFVAE